MKIIMVLSLSLLLLFSACGNKEPTETEVSLSAAASDSFEKAFSQFRSSLDEEEYLKAFMSLHSSLRLFWEKTPLLLNNVQFVKSDDNTFGIYEPREEDSFRIDEPIYLYIEPIGYIIKENPESLYEFGFLADFTIESEEGIILGGQKDFAKLDFKSWNFNTEITLTFTYTISGLDHGKYKIVTQVRDKFSDKKATTENWIYIL